VAEQDTGNDGMALDTEGESFAHERTSL
jgi:hypothetical protein